MENIAKVPGHDKPEARGQEEADCGKNTPSDIEPHAEQRNGTGPGRLRNLEAELDKLKDEKSSLELDLQRHALHPEWYTEEQIAGMKERLTRVVAELETLRREIDADAPHTQQHPTAGRGFPFTDTGNSERLAQRYSDVLRWCEPWRKWLYYDGTRWHVDATHQVQRFAKETARHLRGSGTSRR
jgi:hypothetical protein